MRRGPRARRRVLTFAIAGVLATVMLAVAWPSASPATVLPAGFQETTAITGLMQPTAFRFAPDGRVFVAEKSGLIKVFDNLSDTTPTVFADLRPQVHSFWDRGLLNLILDPSFPTRPYVYVLYVHNAAIGGTAPRWPTSDGTSDDCPTPPGATDDGCVVSGRLSRLQAAGNQMTGSEQVLVEDWCQQYPSHSGGGLAFGADGALYVSGGDGAAFNFVDYGQRGQPLNPCGDPPGGAGTQLSPPTTEGGRLRAQDLRTSGDPVGLNGSLIRIDPDTGAGKSGNPLFSSSDPNARRIVAYGFRNPYRLAIRPQTNDVFVADVGEGAWEEINRVPDFAAPMENLGWPCYQGGSDANGTFTPVRNPSFDALNVNICEGLYSEEPNGSRAPYFAYPHDVPVVPGENCTTGTGNAVTGVAFAPANSTYPAAYRNGLFFADFSRDCIWYLPAGTDGLPNPNSPQLFAQGAPDTVHLETGPNGDLFYLDWDETDGAIRRIWYGTGNSTPVALASATPTHGVAPLAVSFDGSGSTDADNEPLTYAWDLDGDGDFDDSTAQKPDFTYTQAGNYTVQLKVTDPHGLFDTDSVVISAGNTPPSANIVYPNPPMSWEVGQRFTFQGTADDQQDGALPPSAFSWSLLLQHCSAAGSGCHTHSLQTFSGSPSGSFIPPDHDWPSRLELRLTVTDSGGLQDTRTSVLDPVTTVLVFDSNPRGMQLTVGSESSSTPFARRVIVGSRNSVSAPGQTRAGTPYGFTSWSDGKPQSHDVIATQSWTYTATFTADAERPGPPSGLVASSPSAAQVDLCLDGGRRQRRRDELQRLPRRRAASDDGLRDRASPTRRSLRAPLQLPGDRTGCGRQRIRPEQCRERDDRGRGADDPDVRTRRPTRAWRKPIPRANFGTQTGLRVEGGLDPDIESYLRFRVTGVTGPLQSAKLRLWVTDATVDGPAVYTTGNSGPRPASRGTTGPGGPAVRSTTRVRCRRAPGSSTTSARSWAPTAPTASCSPRATWTRSTSGARSHDRRGAATAGAELPARPERLPPARGTVRPQAVADSRRTDRSLMDRRPPTTWVSPTTGSIATAGFSPRPGR